MEKIEFLLRSRLSYILLMSTGGLGSIIVGLNLLFTQEGFFLILGGFFLVFGLGGLIHLLDSLYVVIREDEIEIKSVFRKRITKRDDIYGYGIGKFKIKYSEGERIRLFTENGNIKFHTKQFVSIQKIKDIVKGLQPVPDPFRKERIEMQWYLALLWGVIIYSFFKTFW